MRTTTIFAETHTSERANHVAYRLVYFKFTAECVSYDKNLVAYFLDLRRIE